MEIGPILRALMRNKTRFWLITLEVALTLAIVVNCVNMMLDLRRDFLRPSGYDEENLIVVRAEPFSPDYREEEFVDVVRERDLERLEAIDRVRAATAISAVPLSGGGSATSRKPLGSELETEGAPYFVVSEDALETFGADLAAGRDLEFGDFQYQEDEDGNAIERNVLVTRRLAEALFGEEEALGQVIQNGEGQITNTIVGIIDNLHNSWPQSGDEYGERVMLFPGRPGGDRRMIYMVRVEPGQMEGAWNEVEAAILAAEPNRIVELESLSEIKNETYIASLALTKMLLAVIVLLILVTSLGIIGLTSFSVTERRRQIGTRRALGASRLAIARYFLVESWVVTGIGLTLGIALAYSLNYGLSRLTDVPKIDFTLLVGVVLLFWALGVASALAPAVRASGVPPDLATRTV